MPVFRAEEIPDLPDFAAINRAVPQMPTGMEKEEESVSSCAIRITISSEHAAHCALIGAQLARGANFKLTNLTICPFRPNFSPFLRFFRLFTPRNRSCIR